MNLVGKTFGRNGFFVFAFGKSCDNLRAKGKKNLLKRRFLSPPASEALNFISRNKRQPILIRVLSKNLHHIFRRLIVTDVRLHCATSCTAITIESCARCCHLTLAQF